MPARVRDAAERVTTLVRETPDLSVRVRGAEWTVSDVAAHIVCVLTAIRQSLQGEGDRLASFVPDEPDYRRRLVAVNAASIATVPRGDARHMASLIADGAAALQPALDSASPGDRGEAPWYGRGVTHTAETLAGLALGELTIHGLDIARATGRPWRIDPDVARLIVPAVFPPMLPLMLDRARAGGVAATYDIRVRGGERFSFRLERGTLTAKRGAPSGRADVHLSADPVAFLLVGYGRASQWPAIARGALLAWGRRPWLALSFRSLFPLP